MEKMTVECSHCRKGQMVVVMIPAHMENKSSRGSGQTGHQLVHVCADYKTLTPCNVCGNRVY